MGGGWEKRGGESILRGSRPIKTPAWLGKEEDSKKSDGLGRMKKNRGGLFMKQLRRTGDKRYSPSKTAGGGVQSMTLNQGFISCSKTWHTSGGPQGKKEKKLLVTGFSITHPSRRRGTRGGRQMVQMKHRRKEA